MSSDLIFLDTKGGKLKKEWEVRKIGMGREGNYV